MRLYSHSELTPPARIRHVISVLIVLLAWGCVAVKNPPAGKPYVFENKVTLRDTAISKERLTILNGKLTDYLADSLKVPTKSVLGFTQRVAPPVFDSANVLASLKFMNGYLQSEGFYNARLDTFTVKFDSTQRNKRFFSFNKFPVVEVKTHFFLSLGKSLRIDSIRNDFANPGLQHLADSARATSPLAKNSAYSKQAVAVELERLASIFRTNGYMKMTRAALLAEVDTADLSLVSFLDDPIQQQLAALKRQEDPTARIRIFQRPGTDSSVFLQYLIDSVYIYPDTRITDNPDSLIRFTGFRSLTNSSAVVIREREHLFQEKMLRRNNHLLPGHLYNERNFFRTANSYSQMGPWQQSDVRTITRSDSVPGAVLHMFLYPAKKQSLQIDLEGSQNNNISVSNVLSGRFLAVGVAGTYRSRNVLKRGTQSTTTLRTGLEINNNASSGNEGIFQSLLLTGNQTFSIPRLIWPARHNGADRA
ncbi:MAG: hypothetical protein MUF29_08650, partial [Chitinophagaceae bacterium]|nr:hypothetical protein [Chitinophagaceae bacterium]